MTGARRDGERWALSSPADPFLSRVILAGVGGMILGGGVLGVPLPLVGVDGRWLFVHGGTRSAQVPLEAVGEVRLVWRMRGPRVAVTFDTQTAFGRRVLFQPTLDWMGTAYEHRVVRELRELVARARERGQQGGREH